MSGLLFLTSEDFRIGRGEKGPLLYQNTQGFSIILFYSTQCQYCGDFIEIFKNLPGTVQGCQFGIVNVMKNKQTVELSQQTQTKIKYVPYILFYLNGRPIVRYSGPPNRSEIGKFILEMANRLKGSQKFSANQQSDNIKPSRDTIPEYSIGVPYCEDGVCFLDFDTAYEKK